jgi:hypothetical protein
MITTTVTRPPATPASDADAAVRHRLAGAPAGPYAVLEAALAWHLLRPGGARPDATPVRSRYLPIAETGQEDVAVRLARLLSVLAWAIVTEGGEGGQVCVEVPRMRYHRVIRALTAAWRDARCHAVDPDAAAALWRMALLIGGLGNRCGVIRLRIGPPAAAGMLTAAGRSLGFAPIVDQTPRGCTLVVGQRGDVVRLLRAAGAGEAAVLWTAQHWTPQSWTAPQG